jgi:hypothetical protein
MLAVVVILSILCGAAAVGVAQTLELPFWASLLAYSVGGSIGLLASAAALSSDALRTLKRVQPERAAAVLQSTRQH